MHFYLPRKMMIESVKPLKDLFDMKKWFKIVADYLHIPYADTCCDTTKTTTPVRYNKDTGQHEYYDINTDTWIQFGAGGGGALDSGEATTPNGETLDWGGIITHDVNVDSDGNGPLPSIIWGANDTFKSIEFTSNDILFSAADSFDVDSTNIGFNQSGDTIIDTANLTMRASNNAFMGSSNGLMGYWYFTNHTNVTSTEEGMQLDQINKRAQIGDFNSVNNDTLLTVDDTTQKITLNANNGIIVGTVQAFADNAAALLGGLAVGTIYRTGDALKIVH